jgi:diadenosine tetraphosphate (Ap4A) HIT family hydrolase
MGMSTIFESEYFIVEAPDKPLVDRHDGGHIIITPRNPVSDRQQLTPKQGIELMRLTMVIGEAMRTVLIAHGIDIGRINYQDNGNWSVFKPGGPQLHIHIYGRAISATKQPYGQALFFPHREEHPECYDKLLPLTDDDISALKKMAMRLLETKKYSSAQWRIR